MGTPEFAVPTLERIVKEGYNVVYVVTQPDKPRGRGNKISYSPVKEKALEFNIPVLQPPKIRNDNEFIDKLKSNNIDLIIVVAFGQILTKEILDIPKYGCINVHASLLPKLRGAAPINWAIINGYKETGITTMLMDMGLDTGDMLYKVSTNIGDDETAGELHDRLKILGADAMVETLHMLKDGKLKRYPQDDSQSSYAPMLDKETGKIVWSNSSLYIKNLVRGTNPWPVSYSVLEGIKLKIWSVEIENLPKSHQKPGEVWKVDKEGIHVYTGDGSIIIKEIQGESGKRVSGFSYTLGHPISVGSVFQ